MRSSCRCLLLTWLVGVLPVSTAEASGLGIVIRDRETAVNLPESVHENPTGLTVTAQAALGERGNWEVTWMDLTPDGSLLREGRFHLGNLVLFQESVITSTGDLVVAWSDEFFPVGPETGLVHVTCLDTARTLRWSWSYDPGESSTPVFDRAQGLIELPGGDLLVLSETEESLLLLRLSAEDGAVVTTRLLEGLFATSVAVTETGEIMIAVATTDHPALLSLSPDLDVIGLTRFEAPDSPFVHEVVPRPAGGVWLAGTTSDPVFGSRDAWALALAAEGTIDWQRVYGSAAREETRSAAAGPDGRLLLAGNSHARASRPDAWLLALEADGSIAWEHLHGTDRSERGEALTRLDDGRLVLVAETNQVGGPSEWDAVLFFLDATGELPESCGANDFPPSSSAPLSLVPVPAPVTELPVTVERLAHDLITEDAPSTEIRSCWELVVTEPPREVSPPGAATPLRVDASSRLSWEDGVLSSSTGFNLYRGVLSELVPGSRPTCLAAGLTDTTTTDDEPPPPGTGWFYLVSGVNDLGEGPLGHDSVGAARTAATACP